MWTNVASYVDNPCLVAGGHRTWEVGAGPPLLFGPQSLHSAKIDQEIAAYARHMPNSGTSSTSWWGSRATRSSCRKWTPPRAPPPMASTSPTASLWRALLSENS